MWQLFIDFVVMTFLSFLALSLVSVPFMAAFIYLSEVGFGPAILLSGILGTASMFIGLMFAMEQAG